MAEKRTEGLDVKVLEDHEVLFHFGDKPVIDRKTGTFLKGWHSGGLEPADTTWNGTREMTSNKTDLTGGQTATSRKAGPMTGSVDLIPGSPVLDHIEWPDTVAQDGTLYRLHTPKVAKAHVARVHKFGSGIVGIKASREKADLTVSARNQGNDPTPRTVDIDYKNGDDEVAFEEMYYKVGEDGSVIRVKEKIFQNVSDIQTKITKGEAFVPAASDGSLTAFVPAKDDNDEDGADLVVFGEPKPESAPARSSSPAISRSGSTPESH